MKAGSAVREITPLTSQFLYGYPHVPRMSEGVHDPLLSSALYLERQGPGVLFIANDIVFIPKPLVATIRQRIGGETGLPPEHIFISATHTHSGPKVADHPFHRDDPVIPPVDPGYIELLLSRVSEAGIAAFRSARSAQAGLVHANARGIGTNRHDPAGPSDLDVPVLGVRGVGDGEWIGLMLVCAMHPTVLHEDSRLVSADFPWAAREWIQSRLTGSACPILHHTGCAGNQSPRHVTKANTFGEAERIGNSLGTAVVDAAGDMALQGDLVVRVQSERVDPPRKRFPGVEEAQAGLIAARARFTVLQRTGPAREARTAECDVFGAEHRVALARIAAAGGLAGAYADCTPAEITVVGVGAWFFAGWPAETYVEYGLEAKRACPELAIVCLANGQLHGYITTPEAVAANAYEAGAALFAPETGKLFVQATLRLVDRLR